MVDTNFVLRLFSLHVAKYHYKFKKRSIKESWFYCKQSIKYNIRNVQIFKVVTKSVSNTLFSNCSLSDMSSTYDKIEIVKVDALFDTKAIVQIPGRCLDCLISLFESQLSNLIQYIIYPFHFYYKLSFKE